jgi:hypothetical protein
MLKKQNVECRFNLVKYIVISIKEDLIKSQDHQQNNIQLKKTSITLITVDIFNDSDDEELGESFQNGTQ